jgi:hypothetical protein
MAKLELRRNSSGDARKKKERKWESNGKTVMAKWLSGGISKQSGRKENPDRDKTNSLIAKA